MTKPPFDPLPPIIREILQARLQEALEKYPAALSPDKRAVLIDGGIGYCAWASPDGDLYLETYEPGVTGASKFNRTLRARASVIVLGSRTLPELLQILPKRPATGIDCTCCEATGWRTVTERARFICVACGGLGWVV